ncbi:MAG: Holliday junction resolvase RuvX [Clostridia bacterium]|nr:Holliday junction resolvase RuvX [Clostridia bacterium]
MRIMGLDVGDKKIGVAVSDELGITAQGITTVIRDGKCKDIDELKKIAENYKATKVVVGLPKNMNGSLGPQSEKVISYIKKLKKELNLDYIFWDERLTTVAAEKMLIAADVTRKKRKNIIDKIAAVYILQSYLDSRN